MLTFISCAKTMTRDTAALSLPLSTPRYAELAAENARAMAQYSTEELAAMLHVSRAIAQENSLRYADFALRSEALRPAILSYTGVVFQHIAPADFTAEDFLWAQDHLRITSFLYGLLRPLDGIRNYRMEGALRLEEHGSKTMFEFWRERLTDEFIAAIRAQGGTLVNLASGEMKNLFDWKRIERKVRVITPEFRQWKNGRLAVVTVYAKMCRGEMVRHFIKQRVEQPDVLKEFAWEGFRYSEEHSTDSVYMFIAE